MFEPFKMPNFCARPDGKSKLLKEAYIKLRRLDYPDKDIFIYANGEFNSFKGEILEQQPLVGEMVYPGDRVIIISAVPGVCHLMPDLFTDHIGSSCFDVSNPRHSVKNLFSVIDSMFLKMNCRLEWIRDIYAGVYRSRRITDYLNSVFFASESKIDNLDSETAGFILPKLSRFQGTEGALKVFIESMTGLKVKVYKSKNQRTNIPVSSISSFGENCKLGENIFLGNDFEADKPELDISFQLNNLEDIQKILNATGDEQAIKNLMEYILPYFMSDWKISIQPNDDRIGFKSGNSFLGVSTALCPDDGERG